MKKLIPVILILLAHVGSATPLPDTTFVAFDVETTGFSPATERIIEIGAVKYRNGEIVKSTHWLINPSIPINNSFVHNITDEMIVGYPGFADTYKAFVQFVGDSVLIAHNASFDVRFMATEIERNKLEAIPNPVVNSLALFRKWYPQEPAHKLGVLAEHIKLPTGDQHRAEDDAETLLRILRHGMAARPNLTLQQIKADSNGFYYFDGSRK